MKSNIKKDGIIYKYMNKYRLKNIRIIFILGLVLAGYFMLFGPYITNVLFGATDLDTARFKSDAKMITIMDETLSDNKNNSINANVIKSDSYWQGDKYEFSVQLDNVKNTGITYTTENTNENFNPETSEPVTSAVLYTADINGINTLVLAYPHDKLKSGSVVSGIFAPIAPIIRCDLSAIDDYADSEVYEYMLDMRGIQMESEEFDILIFSVLILIILYLSLKTVVYYISPGLTPTYRRLSKYGELLSVVDDVEAQLKEKNISKITKNNPIYLEDWIVSKDVFKLSITKNHAKPQDNSRYGSKL